VSPVLHPPLVFDWRKDRWRLGLAVLLGGSFLVHVLSFYIFQTIYPATTSLPPASAGIAVLNPKDPAQSQLLDWLELHNPASISAPAFDHARPGKLIPPYHPTFSTSTPELLGASQTKTPAVDRLPTLFAPESFFPARAKPETKPQTFPSSLSFSDKLQPLAPDHLPPLPTSGRSVGASSFFLGVAPDGSVSDSFLWRSSGDHNLDQTAEAYLRALRFRPADKASWGIVRLRWGTS
jgi:hypothetical protein